MNISKKNKIQNSIDKLSQILTVAAIDVECIGCKEVYPNFIFQLITRIKNKAENSSFENRKISDTTNAYQDKSGQLFGMNWEQLQKRNLLTTVKSKQKNNKSQKIKNSFQMIHNSALKGEIPPNSQQTPQTKRYRYNMGKANAISLAVDKKHQNLEIKDQYEMQQSDIKLNELSSGGKFVFGRSGCKWDKGENFPDIQQINFYESSKKKHKDNQEKGLFECSAEKDLIQDNDLIIHKSKKIQRRLTFGNFSEHIKEILMKDNAIMDKENLNISFSSKNPFLKKSDCFKKEENLLNLGHYNSMIFEDDHQSFENMFLNINKTPLKNKKLLYDIKMDLNESPIIPVSPLINNITPIISKNYNIKSKFEQFGNNYEVLTPNGFNIDSLKNKMFDYYQKSEKQQNQSIENTPLKKENISEIFQFLRSAKKSESKYSRNSFKFEYSDCKKRVANVFELDKVSKKSIFSKQFHKTKLYKFDKLNSIKSSKIIQNSVSNSKLLEENIISQAHSFFENSCSLAFAQTPQLNQEDKNMIDTLLNAKLQIQNQNMNKSNFSDINNKQLFIPQKKSIFEPNIINIKNNQFLQNLKIEEESVQNSIMISPIKLQDKKLYDFKDKFKPCFADQRQVLTPQRVTDAMRSFRKNQISNYSKSHQKNRISQKQELSHNKLSFRKSKTKSTQMKCFVTPENKFPLKAFNHGEEEESELKSPIDNFDKNYLNKRTDSESKKFSSPSSWLVRNKKTNRINLNLTETFDHLRN